MVVSLEKGKIQNVINGSQHIHLVQSQVLNGHLLSAKVLRQ